MVVPDLVLGRRRLYRLLFECCRHFRRLLSLLEGGGGFPAGCRPLLLRQAAAASKELIRVLARWRPVAVASVEVLWNGWRGVLPLLQLLLHIVKREVLVELFRIRAALDELGLLRRHISKFILFNAINFVLN